MLLAFDLFKEDRHVARAIIGGRIFDSSSSWEVAFPLVFLNK